jgi:hypothetical protein
VCSWIDVLQLSPGRVQDPALARRVYESCLALAETGAPLSRFWPQSRLEYVVLLSRYYAGVASLDEAVNGLAGLFYLCGDDDYSEEGLFRMLHTPTVIYGLLEASLELTPEQLAWEKDNIIRRVTHYSEHIPGGADRQHVNNCLGQFAKFCIGKADSKEYLDLLIRFTSFGHMSTYIHSVQVKTLGEILAEYLLKHDPDFFGGLCGGNREAILGLVHYAGLCHDIGKVSYVNTVALSSRRLYDFEFGIIKNHVSAGAELHAGDETMACVRDVITGHHKWYDGTGGYPEGFDNRASPFAPVIDIISAADSIDAATDAVGRSYAAAHTLGQIIAEIQSQAGTRYAPAIAGILANPALYGEISLCIDEGRKDVYYQAYEVFYAR